jgi:hypothetical protein
LQLIGPTTVPSIAIFILLSFSSPLAVSASPCLNFSFSTSTAIEQRKNDNNRPGLATNKNGRSEYGKDSTSVCFVDNGLYFVDDAQIIYYYGSGHQNHIFNNKDGDVNADINWTLTKKNDLYDIKYHAIMHMNSKDNYENQNNFFDNRRSLQFIFSGNSCTLVNYLVINTSKFVIGPHGGTFNGSRVNAVSNKQCAIN